MNWWYVKLSFLSKCKNLIALFEENISNRWTDIINFPFDFIRNIFLWIPCPGNNKLEKKLSNLVQSLEYEDYYFLGKP